MPILFTIVVSVGALVGAVLLFGFASPRIARMKRSIEIAATPARVFPYLNTLKLFVEQWSPWTEKDPDARHTYNEIPQGVGAGYSWEGHPRKVGSGSMEIRESVADARVKVFLQFKGRGEAFAGWLIEDLGNGKVRVTWDFEADNGNNPMARIFGRMMDKFLGPDYEKGLARLKSICERPA